MSPTGSRNDLSAGASQTPMGDSTFRFGVNNQVEVRKPGEAKFNVHTFKDDRHYSSDEQYESDNEYAEDDRSVRGGGAFDVYGDEREDPYDRFAVVRDSNEQPEEKRRSRQPRSSSSASSPSHSSTSSSSYRKGGADPRSSSSSSSSSQMVMHKDRRVRKLPKHKGPSNRRSFNITDGNCQAFRVDGREGIAYSGRGKALSFMKHVSVPFVYTVDIDENNFGPAGPIPSVMGIDEKNLRVAIAVHIAQKYTVTSKAHPNDYKNNMHNALVCGIEVIEVNNQSGYPINIRSLDHFYLNKMMLGASGGCHDDGILYHVGPNSSSRPNYLSSMRNTMLSPTTALLAYYGQHSLDEDYSVMPNRKTHYTININSIIWAMAASFMNYRTQWNLANSQVRGGYVENIAREDFLKFLSAAERYIALNLTVKPVFSGSSFKEQDPKGLVMEFTPAVSVERSSEIASSSRMSRSEVKSGTVTLFVNVDVCIPVEKEYGKWHKHFVENVRGRLIGGDQYGSTVPITARPFIFIDENKGDMMYASAQASKESTKD